MGPTGLRACLSSHRRSALLLFSAIGMVPACYAQSTLGSVSGRVQDASGALLGNAQVHLHRVETASDRDVSTNAEGTYTVQNLEPGHYDITVEAPGLAATVARGVEIIARQQLRYDVSLKVASANQSVTVNAATVGVINTENAQISSSLSPQSVLDLPANYRGAGSTSPMNVIQTLPGVQPDTSGYPASPSTHPAPSLKFSIQGGLPSQSETTVDGISAQNQTNNNTQNDAFPSAESIAEIRVDGVNNNAEYGQPGEVTTVTKSGTNHVHGSAYEYLQNQFLNAIPFGSNAANKPHVVANDFGGSFGGPAVIPHFYNGHDKTFFFGAYEGLRYPQSNVLQAKVPTVLMKQGNFSQETATPLINPFTGGTYANNTVPINASSAPFLQFYPDPNVDAALSLQGAIADKGYNYLSTRRDDISSNQFDLRGDQTVSQRATVFARYTWKNIDQVQPADLTLPNSTAYGQYRIFATSLNYAFTPHLADEFRFGFTLERDGNANPFNGPAFTSSTQLNGVTPAFFNGIPHLGFDSEIASIGERLGFEERSRIFQYVDNLTLQAGTHSIRFGTDLRHLIAHTEAGGSTSSINYGNLSFTNGSNSATGQEFADFLVGVPYQSQTESIVQDNDGTTNSYAFYAQDNWNATPNLNLTFGLRYEFHPAFVSSNGLTGNFDPSVPLSGRLIYPAGHASTLSVEELASVNACSTAGVTNPYATNAIVNGAPCTPVVTNTQAGLPAGLRHAPLLRFEPRFGFAYRPFGNDRTAIRGGAGYYNITTTGALFYAIAQTLQSNFQTFTNTYSPSGPAFSFPNIAPGNNTFTPAYGNVYFYAAIDTNWHDPYSLQSDLSIDHDFGHNFGGRISYVGLHTWHLVWQPEYNQLPKSSTTPSSVQPRTAYPFPNFYAITARDTAGQADYHSLQAEISHRASNGLSFDSAYTLAKNLSDNQGSNGSFAGSSFVDEQGGYNPTDSFNRHQDYGNVSSTRRHRWLSTAIYELPVGRGREFGAHMNRLADAALGGWQVSNIFLWQSGTFLTASLPSYDIDPSGTGSGPIGGASQRPDRVANGNTSAHNRNQWFNPNAFACPGQTGYASLAPSAATGQTPCTVGVGTAPIGRFGTESVGDLTGPGTVSLSSGVSKSIDIVEGVRLRGEATFTNVLNHTNLADPQTDISQSNFGQITQSRGSDFGGNRTGQLSLRLEF